MFKISKSAVNEGKASIILGCKYHEYKQFKCKHASAWVIFLFWPGELFLFSKRRRRKRESVQIEGMHLRPFCMCSTLRIQCQIIPQTLWEHFGSTHLTVEQCQLIRAHMREVDEKVFLYFITLFISPFWFIGSPH